MLHIDVATRLFVRFGRAIMCKALRGYPTFSQYNQIVNYTGGIVQGLATLPPRSCQHFAQMVPQGICKARTEPCFHHDLNCTSLRVPGMVYSRTYRVRHWRLPDVLICITVHHDAS